MLRKRIAVAIFLATLAWLMTACVGMTTGGPGGGYERYMQAISLLALPGSLIGFLVVAGLAVAVRDADTIFMGMGLGFLVGLFWGALTFFVRGRVFLLFVAPFF